MKIQISPYGNFIKKKLVNGKVVERNQLCDRAAFEAVKNKFDQDKKELLFDYEHERGRAAGWITALHITDDGLYADVRPTPAGRKSVRDEEYLYTSADWFVGADDRPMMLMGASLTNDPNIEVERIQNTKYFKDGGTEASATNSQAAHSTAATPKPNMKQIALKLGLAESATEAEIVGAVGELQTRIQNSAKSLLEAEADAFIEKHKERITNTAKVKEAYILCPGAVQAVFGNMAAEAAKAERVTNSKDAKGADDAGGVKVGAEKERIQNSIAKAKEWMAMPTSSASIKFRADNDAAITEGLNHIQE